MADTLPDNSGWDCCSWDPSLCISAVYIVAAGLGHTLVDCTGTVPLAEMGGLGKTEAAEVVESEVVDLIGTDILLLLLDTHSAYDPYTSLHLASLLSGIPLLPHNVLPDCCTDVHRPQRQNLRRASRFVDDLFEEEHSCYTAQVAVAVRDVHEDCHMHLYMLDHSGEKPCQDWLQFLVSGWTTLCDSFMNAFADLPRGSHQTRRSIWNFTL